MKKLVSVLLTLMLMQSCNNNAANVADNAAAPAGVEYGKLDRASLPTKSFDEIFAPIAIADVPESVFKLVGNDFSVITAGTPADHNSMVAGWGGWGILLSEPVTWCMLRANRYTLEYMRREQKYTMSYFDEAQKEEIMLFGSKSGRDSKKMSEHSLLPIATPGGSVAYKEAKLVIECTLTEVTTVSPDDFYTAEGRTFVTEAHAEAGDWHKLVFGTVTGVWSRK